MTQQIKKAVERRDAAPLGVLVWWGAFLARVAPADLQDLCRKHGLPEDVLPEPPTPEKAFRRAAQHAGSAEKGWRLDLTSGTDRSEITYSVQERRLDSAARKHAWVHVARVSWFPALPWGRNFQSDNPDHPAVRAVAATLPGYARNYVTEDVHLVVNEVMRRCKAIPLAVSRINSRFVPAGHADLVAQLAAVLAEVPGAGVETITVPDDDGSRATMVRAAQSEFASQVEAAEAELALLAERMNLARATGEKGPRDTTIENRVAEFKDLRDRVTLYGDVLRFKADDLTGRLGQVEAGLRRLLGLA
jgi:hypothetical protein